MPRAISYKQAISLAVEDEDMILYLDEIIHNHKNWGSFTLRKLPSYVVVALVERIKAMAEQTLGDQIPVDVDDADIDA